MTTRKRVANRRAHETIAIEHMGQRFKIGLGREFNCNAVGPVVEVFINAQQVNSTMDAIAGDGAILMSLLIQYGHPIAEIFHSMKKNSDGSPASPLGRAAALINEASQQGD
jgi:hypothetical protein